MSRINIQFLPNLNAAIFIPNLTKKLNVKKIKVVNRNKDCRTITFLISAKN